MPVNNCFQHQQYPTVPAVPPEFHRLRVSDGSDFDFSRLHSQLGVTNVIVVHGTFMGDDPFAIHEITRAIGQKSPLLDKPLETLVEQMQGRLKPIADDIIKDVGNYTDEFVKRFQQLAGDDPPVERLTPTWSGQNHHLARADLAIRLFCRLLDAAPAQDEIVLLWGHSHAGNGFALLTNLLANDREAVNRFFTAAGHPTAQHWQRAREILQNTKGPHPYAKSVCFVTFGTPVRYGWDTNGCGALLHILHHRNEGRNQSIVATPVFPLQSFQDMISARYGDWVQSFGIAGTDVVPPTATKQNQQLSLLLEGSLKEPDHQLDTKFLLSERLRNICARWKTGTRCHTDGLNLLVDYEASGRTTAFGQPVEAAIYGHGVATTIDWLPCHLSLVTETLQRVFAH